MTTGQIETVRRFIRSLPPEGCDNKPPFELDGGAKGPPKAEELDAALKQYTDASSAQSEQWLLKNVLNRP